MAGSGAASSAANGDLRRELETGTHPVVHIVHGDILRLLVEFLFNDHCETVYLEYIVGLGRFIQNHRQGGATSPARLEEYSYRADLLALEVFLQYLLGFFRYMNHADLLFISSSGKANHYLLQFNYY